MIIPEATDLPNTTSLRGGMRVCFTGEAVVEETQVHRSKLEEYTALVGMQPVKSVTKKGCDLLVAFDTFSHSGKDT